MSEGVFPDSRGSFPGFRWQLHWREKDLFSPVSGHQEKEPLLAGKTPSDVRVYFFVKEPRHSFAYIEKFSLHFSNSSFAIRVNLLHP